MNADKKVVQKIILAGVIVKDNKVTFSRVEGASSTIAGALTIKMLGYLRSAVKNIGQHEYSSTAVIGDNVVLILLKHQTMEALLLIGKDKFKEAIEEWKAKLKNV